MSAILKKIGKTEKKVNQDITVLDKSKKNIDMLNMIYENLKEEYRIKHVHELDKLESEFLVNKNKLIKKQDMDIMKLVSVKDNFESIINC